VVGRGSADLDDRILSGVVGVRGGGGDAEVALDVLRADGVEQTCNCTLCAAHMKLEHDGTDRRMCVLTLSVCAKVWIERAGTLLSCARAAHSAPNAQRGRGAGRQAGGGAARKGSLATDKTRRETTGDANRVGDEGVRNQSRVGKPRRHSEPVLREPSGLCDEQALCRARLKRVALD
jgi:hypothetical protein